MINLNIVPLLSLEVDNIIIRGYVTSTVASRRTGQRI